MRLSRLSVRRPIFTTMIALVVLLLGAISLRRLPVDLMPDITFPTLSVGTSYENASPEEVEKLVTRPIEEAMSAMPGVEEVTSASTEGSSNVRITFAWGTDLDAAASDIRDRLDRVIPRLPTDADRPVLRKFDLASFPILILGASSDLDPMEMRRKIDEEVKYRIERVPGVASLDVWGGWSREIHVDLYPDKVKALGVSVDQIISRIAAGNVNVPAGSIERGRFEVTVRTPGEYTDLNQLNDAVIAVQEGAPMRLAEVADVRDTWQRPVRIARVNGKPGIRLSVNKQSGTNTAEVGARVLKELEGIRRDIPQIDIVPIVNSADYIQRSISGVGSAALYGGAFAVLVLLFFLRSFRSTAIIATAIPLSIVATFALLYFGGMTLNLMTLGGLALGVGMLLDNSIVVLENIFRLRESGRGHEAAAVDGAEEVTSAVMASTLTTVAVFLPMVFVRGMSGVMFRQLAYVIAFALLCSLAAALTVVPMLAARVRLAENSRPRGHESAGHWIFRVSGRLFTHMENRYKRLLHLALNHRLLTVTCAVLLLAGSLALIPLVGAELMPQTDEGQVRISAEMAVGTRLGVTDGEIKFIEAVAAKAAPETQSTVTSVGGSPWLGSVGNTGDLQLSLKPEAERERSSEDVADDLRRRLSNLPGLTVRVRTSEGMLSRMMSRGMGGAERVQLEIRGYDLEVADALTTRLKSLVEQVDGVTDVRLSTQSGSPEEAITPDRQKAADMKVTVSAIANLLETALSGTRASNFRQEGDEYPIIVKLKGAEQMDMRDILDLTVTNAEGQPVVLRNVVSAQPRTGPTRIERKNQERVTTLSANIAGRDMGSIIADIREGLRAVPIPRGFSIVFGGDYEEQQKAFRELLLSIVLAIVLVYMVMACQYESLLHPFVVMFSVPFAAIGVVLMLFLTNTTFNVQSFIGCIMLGGIVVNNAILLVDHTNLLRRRDGMPVREAIEEAGRRRLRPILMTALTTVLGLTPLAIGAGEGGQAQAPMARAVIGGLMSSTLITLVLVPVVYSIFERGGRRKSPAEQAGLPAEAKEVSGSDAAAAGG